MHGPDRYVLTLGHSIRIVLFFLVWLKGVVWACDQGRMRMG